MSATSLDVRPKDYGLDWMIDLRFIMVNVADLYILYKDAIKHEFRFLYGIDGFMGFTGDLVQPVGRIFIHAVKKRDKKILIRE